MLLHIGFPNESNRIQAAHRVAENWRIRRRLPRITKFAIKIGIIKSEEGKQK